MAKLGIDLGTSNSAAAVVFDADEKNPYTVEPIEGDYLGDFVFPSYVAFNKKGEISTAGLPAKERFIGGQSDLVVRHFKRLIGRPFDYVANQISQDNRAFSEFRDRIKRSNDGSVLFTIGEKDISVVEIASYLLKKIVEDSQAFAQKWGEKINSAVVTLPAGFDDSQRQDTVEAAKLAGLEGIDITVIEEPTAAAVARGLVGMEGKIMVVDVGAGTTDVIVGYMEQTQYGPHLTMTGRDCDDVLGGIDMDYLILDHIRKIDSGSPKLEDILDELKADQRLRLMGKIEEAKIVASRDGAASVSINLSVGGARPKGIHVPLDEVTLSEIVEPIIVGEKVNNHSKGVKPVVERALLKAAGGNLSTVPKVVDEIEWLILIGGPCRMRCLHEMLKDVFKRNANIIVQIDNIDRTDRLIKEAVAHGAALSQVKGIEVTNSVPHTVSIFHQSGLTPVIAAGTPFDRGQGTSRSVSLPATRGSNLIWILSQKDSQPTREWSMHSHTINVPQEGKMKVNLKWGEGGVETDKASVEGCGLPGSIDFPRVSNRTTLGALLEDRHKWYLSIAKDLRRLMEMARDPLVRWFVTRGATATQAERQTDELLKVSELDLKQCDDINIDTEGYVTDEDIDVAGRSGYLEMRQQAMIERGLVSARVAEVLDGVILPLLIDQTPVTPAELISEAYALLNASSNCSGCMQFWQQLSKWSHKLELVPNDHGVASATATALGALADCLYEQQVISQEQSNHIQDILWRFYGGQ